MAIPAQPLNPLVTRAGVVAIGSKTLVVRTTIAALRPSMSVQQLTVRTRITTLIARPQNQTMVAK